MIPEGISIFKLNNIKENLDINVRLPRTKTASEKPKELIDLIIEKTTKIGTLLLDPFA
jgi:DNA modification methylase